MANHQQRISPSPRNPPLPASSVPATPSAPGLDVLQSGGSQETGTSKNIAKWDHQKRLYLIELLKLHDVPRYRTHNAWSKEAWTGILAQFNKKFSLSFSVAQVKRKEQDLKKEYRTIKDLVAESGFGWDSDRMMVTAPPDVWAAMEACRNKDALFWRDKSFPYYDDLFALYDWRYAEGRSCRGMDHYANKAISPSPVSPDVQLQSPSPSLPSPSSFSFDIEEEWDDANWFGNDAFTPLGNIMPQETPDGQSYINLAPHVPGQFEETPRDGKPNKKQKTKHTIATEDFHEKYLKLKKEEIERFAAIEEKKLDDPFSINKCITVLEGLSELQTGDMLKAADIFKDNPSNREVFLSFGSDALRVGWLLRQI